RRIGPVLGVDRTGEPDAEATTNARGSTVARLRVDHQRYARRRPPERAGGGGETHALERQWKRRHRIATPPAGGARRFISCDAQRPLDLVVEGREVVIP